MIQLSALYSTNFLLTNSYHVKSSLLTKDFAVACSARFVLQLEATAFHCKHCCTSCLVNSASSTHCVTMQDLDKHKQQFTTNLMKDTKFDMPGTVPMTYKSCFIAAIIQRVLGFLTLCKAKKTICILQGKVHWARSLRTAKHRVASMRILLEEAQSQCCEVLFTHPLKHIPSY